jgi:hypothetical protein
VHVHGYRGFDVRNNLYYLPDGLLRISLYVHLILQGRLVYHTAAVGIVHDTVKNEQVIAMVVVHQW